MIIELDRSLIDLGASGAAELNSVISMLELVAISYREGNHLVFAEPSIAVGLLDLIAQRSELASALLVRVKNRYPQVAALANKVKVKLIVGAFNSAAVEATESCRRIKYPAADVTSNIIQKSIVLVENLEDINFYRWVAGAVLKDTDYSGIPLAIEGYPGGGNTTAEAYKNIKENTSRLCLCIVDSDIRAPGLSPGETAKKVQRHDRDAPNPRACHLVIDACSVENFVPFEVFEQAWRDDPELTARLEEYRLHYREGHWRYLQLKKGITCFEVRDTNVFSAYWSVNLPQSAAACTTPERSCSAKNSCKANRLSSLSSAPLNVVRSLGIEEMDKISYELLPDIKRAWERVTYELLGWCCAVPSSSL